MPPLNHAGPGLRRTLTLAAIATPILVAWAIIALATGDHPTLDQTPKGGVPVITEFGDFQCPHCAVFAIRTYPRLRQDFIDTGRATFEYRHYPFLSEHSTRAALASECARDQGMFQEFHDLVYRDLYEHRPATRENLDAIALRLDLNPGAYAQCLDSQAHAGRIERDQRLARAHRVSGTPALVLEGTTIRWTSYPDLRNQLNAIISDREEPTQPETPGG